MEQAAIERFLSSLEEQHQLYLAMIDIDRQQAELLSNEHFDSPDALLELVHQKQHLMGLVSSIEQTLQPLRDEWHRWRSQLPESMTAPVESALGSMAETIRILIELEDESQQRLSTLRGSAQQDLETIRRKSQINKAYSAYGSQRQGPKFIDQRTEG